MRTEPLISVVVPVLDEESTIACLLDHLGSLPGRWETIVADGGSRDRTASLAAGHAQRPTVIQAPRGRANQMNAGAAAAAGDVLLFLHADTRLPAEAYASLVEALHYREVLGGTSAWTSTAATASRACSAPGTGCSVASASTTATRRSGCGAARSTRSAGFGRCRSWRTTTSCDGSSAPAAAPACRAPP